MSSSVELGFLLDRQWYWLRGDMDRSKKPTLLELARILGEQQVPYAIIGGIALQVHQAEPRTTLDIDLAVLDRNHIPRLALREAGFIETGVFEHSENWRAADETPVQFSDDPEFADAISRADTFEVDGMRVSVLRIQDLFRAKLRAAADGRRRRSKRLQDLADVQALLERQPDLETLLTIEERALLAALP